MSRTQQAIHEFEITDVEKLHTLDAFLRIPSVSADPDETPPA